MPSPKHLLKCEFIRRDWRFSLTEKTNTTFQNLVLGLFSDQDALNTNPSDYAGTITWGDRKTSSASFKFAGVTSNSNSFWKITGTHKYTTKKTYMIGPIPTPKS